MSAPRPDVPALPVTFRPTLTRVVLLSVGLAMFLVITVIALMLERLNPGSGSPSSSSPRSSSAS